MLLCVLLILISIVGNYSHNNLPKIELKLLDTNQRVFIDNSGRELHFHGVNSIVKGFPYVPLADKFDVDISLSEEDHLALESLGVNVYRLGIMWKGAEPVKGEFNQTYFNIIRKITEAAAEHNIYTIFDLHQDVISEKYCGEGVPDWIINDDNNNFPNPKGDAFVNVASDGYPTRQDCSKYSWSSYYGTESVSKAFGALYSADYYLNDWKNYWGEVARQFNDLNSVLGYELINEPWAGDVFSDPLLLIPSVSDKKVLQPAYDTIVPEIRKYDNRTLILFAGVTWDDIVPVGFDHAPDGNAGQSVFAYHYYHWPQYDPESYFIQRENDAQRLGTGMFLSEFERPLNNNDFDNDTFVKVADVADFHQVSYTLWEYKTFCIETNETLNSDSQAAAYGSCKTGYGERLIFNENGQLNPDACKKIARTYPQKVAGRTKSIKFDAKTGYFELSWILDTSIILPTEIFAHMELYYPNGIDVNIMPFNTMEWQHSLVRKNILEIHSKSHAANGSRITITIKPL